MSAVGTQTTISTQRRWPWDRWPTSIFSPATPDSSKSLEAGGSPDLLVEG